MVGLTDAEVFCLAMPVTIRKNFPDLRMAAILIGLAQVKLKEEDKFIFAGLKTSFTLMRLKLTLIDLRPMSLELIRFRL